MIHIAIVDDDSKMCDHIKQLIINTFTVDDLEYRSYVFESAVHFMKSQKTFYDVILLDIDMPVLDGLNTARILREQNIKSIVIFVTSKVHYMPEAFGVNVFSFIDKNKLDSVLPKTLKNCISYITKNVSISFRTNEGQVMIQTNDIVFAEFFNRKVAIHTTNGVHEVNLNCLVEFLALLNNKDFIYINRGTIINLKYLESVVNKKARLKGIKETLRITKYKEVKKSMMDYTSRRGII